MNRRGFLGTLIGGVAAAAAVRTFPFRVFSFPAAPVIPSVDFAAAIAAVRRQILLDTIEPMIWYLSSEQAAAYEILAAKVKYKSRRIAVSSTPMRIPMKLSYENPKEMFVDEAATIESISRELARPYAS